MNRFASGPKRNYYGKGDVIVYRLNRQNDGSVFAASVLMLLYGEAFWTTYTTGDNSQLVATDSMKNFIQRETINFAGDDLDSYVQFLAKKFLTVYPDTEGIQVTATEIPYSGALVYTPAGPERATARIEIEGEHIVEHASGWEGFKLLRLRGSAFKGFIRDEYTTLPDIENRPLHMWLDLEWTGSQGSIAAPVRRVVHEVFHDFESGSIQQVIHRIGSRLLADFRDIEEVRLEAQNRTWDTIIEHAEESGVYTDARPPYGCLGLTLRR